MMSVLVLEALETNFRYLITILRICVYVFICEITLTATRRPFISSIFRLKSSKVDFYYWFDKVILKPTIYCQLRLINRRECAYEINAHIKKKKKRVTWNRTGQFSCCQHELIYYREEKKTCDEWCELFAGRLRKRLFFRTY